MKRITLIAFTIYFLNGIVEITVLPYLYGSFFITAVRYLCYAWFFISSVGKIKRISRVGVAVFICALLIFLQSGKITALTTFLVMFAMADADIETVIKKVMPWVAALFFAVVGASLINVIPNWEFYRESSVRYALGFHYPTDTHAVFLLTALAYAYCGRHNKYITLAMHTLNSLLFIATDGRLGFILTFFALILPYLPKFRTELWRYACTLPIILTGVSFILCFFDKGIINDLLSGRLYYAKQALIQYPLTLFGHNITWYGYGGFGHTPLPPDYSYNFVDISFIRVLLDYGIAGLILALAGYTAGIKKCGDNKTAAVLCTVMLWAFTEPILLMPTRNIFLLIAAPFLYKAEDRK